MKIVDDDLNVIYSIDLGSFEEITFSIETDILEEIEQIHEETNIPPIFKIDGTINKLLREALEARKNK